MPSISDSKCVLVIGATAGIGRALALAILALPTKPKVIVSGRRKERLDELVQQGDGRIAALQVDISAGKETLKKSERTAEEEMKNHLTTTPTSIDDQPAAQIDKVV